MFVSIPYKLKWEQTEMHYAVKRNRSFLFQINEEHISKNTN